MKANAVGDIPRNRKQLYNIKTSMKSSCSDDDALLVLWQCAKNHWEGMTTHLFT